MSEPEETPAHGIAVIGMAGRFPGADSAARFWENLKAGREAITFWSAEELRAAGVDPRLLDDPAYVRARGVIDGPEQFDAAFFGFNPREAEIMDPQHRVLLECAWQALEHAGYDAERYPGLIGVYAGSGANTYLLFNLYSNRELIEAVGLYQAMLASEADFLSTRISYKLNLRGPSLTVQTACSTSLVAVHLAVQSLWNGECDIALAGGVRISVPQRSGYLHTPGGILSPDGHCRPFDAAAGGAVDGDGAGIVVLKRLADALADGDHIHALILGSAINNDGAVKIGYTAPSARGQADVVALAQALAEVAPETISYVETHGTATPLGDPIEISALAEVFSGSEESAGTSCALGSVKGNIGHLDAAAGVAGLIKTVLALEHRQLPPSLHFERPNPRLDLAATPFYVNTQLADWPAGETSRRAGVSSFGIGGTNAHVVLEEAPSQPPGGLSRPRQLLLLSAATASALETATENLALHLQGDPETDLAGIADTAFTLAVGRRAFPHRRMVVARDAADAAGALAALDPKRVLSRLQEGESQRVAFLFPGQGSQYPGMASALYAAEPTFRREVDRAADLLRPFLKIDGIEGLDIREVLGAGEPGDPGTAAVRLTQTALAQPALFVVEYALARLWMEWGVRPDAMLGHSVGELVAACLASVFTLEEALSLVAARGRLMQEMAPGAMLSVALGEGEVRPLFSLVGPGLEIAAINTPTLSVVSGPEEAIVEISRRLAERGIENRRLHTSHAFHSASMDPVVERFRAEVARLRPRAPEVPILSNRTGAWLTPEEATDPRYWAEHLRHPVLFSAGLTELFARPGLTLLEVGPGRTLTALARRHPGRPPGRRVLPSLPTAQEAGGENESILRALGQLWLAGVEVDWNGFYAHERRRRAVLPTYPFERKRFWVEPKAEAPGPRSLGLAGSLAVVEAAGEQGGGIGGGHDRPDLTTAYVAPRSATEERLAAIWREILGVDAVGVHDDFFELGGHSLLGTQLVSRVRSELRVEVPLARLFEAATVADLAALIEAGREAGRLPSAPPILEPREPSEPDEPPLVPLARSASAPLSFAQQRLWFLDRLAPGSVAYNLPRGLRLGGGVDPAALAASFSEIVRRHESLRTTFVEAEGRLGPVQVVAPPAPLFLPLVDLAGLPPAEREREGWYLGRQESRRPFDLARGPLLRTLLVRLAPDDHLLSVVMHHIVADGWSIGVFVGEMEALYPAFRAGLPSPLSELPIQYADFALWQRGRLERGAFDGQIDYWRRQLAAAPEDLDLPYDRPRGLPKPAVESFRNGLLPFAVPPALASDLGVLARRHGATLAMALVGGFQALLGRYTGQEDLAVGVAIAGRNRREIEGLIGFFVNTLVFRADLSGAPETAETLGFGGLLDRTRRVALGAYAHQDLPFDKLVEVLQPARSLSRHPFFQVMFGFETLRRQTLEMPGLTLSNLEEERVDTGAAKFDLTLSMTEGPGELAGLFEYNVELFDPATIARLRRHFENLLRSAVRQPETPLGDLPLLDPEERRQLVEDWNATASPYPADASLGEVFEAEARRAPDAPAVVYEGAVLTYGELDRRAECLALDLRRLGVGREDLVGLCLARSLGLVVGMLGVLKAGGAYVPLDPGYPPERLGFMLEDTGLRVLVAEESTLGSLPPHRAEVMLLDGDRRRETPAGTGRQSPLESLGGAGLAYVMYTSGSTGRPKGVAVTHRGILRLVREPGYLDFGPHQVLLQLAPVSFDASTAEIWGALLNGGCLVLPPVGPLSLSAIGDAIDRHGITSLFLTTGLFHLMVDHQLERLRPVGCLLAGGDVLSPQRVERVLAELPDTRMVVCYGPTENTTFTSCQELLRPGDAGTSVPLGQPIANTRVYVLDRGGQPVPVGIPGELYAGGEGLARGYLGRPELTAERFVPDPFGAGSSAGGRLYRTGDLARYRSGGAVGPDGRLEFLGRFDNQVKLRGFRIEPGEIEARLAEHPGVGDSVVAIHEDPPGNRFLVAYVVPAAIGSLESGELVEPVGPDALKAYLGTKLPDYMVPAVFVFLEALPLTPNAKVDRRRLPDPRLGAPADAGLHLAPRTRTERALAGIWTELLGIARVGATDDFFALGGHSLLATAAVSRIRAELEVELPLRAFFESPRLAELATRIEALAGAEFAPPPAPPIVAVPRDEPPALSFAQERLWFLDRLDRAPLYNETAAFRLRGPLDLPALSWAFSAIVARHEILRTSFREVAGRMVQWISDDTELRLPLVDLSALSGNVGEAERLEREQARRPFDLARGPLGRGLIARLAAADHVVLLSLHHIISDAWSTEIFVRELSALYPAALAGQPSWQATLPPLPIQYADFAVWQRRWLEGEVLERQLSYWRRRLAGAPILELAGDHPRPLERTASGAQVTFALAPELTTGVEARSRQYGASPFMVLLAAFQALLWRYTGEEDSLVGSPIANRTHRETEGLIGFFVNLLALRTHLAGDPGFGDLVARVRETALEAYAHQDLPFEKLVAELATDRSLRGNPLFQIASHLVSLPATGLTLPGLELEPFPSSRFAKLDLNLMWLEERGRLSGMLEYDSEIFEEPTIRRLLGHLTRLLAGALADPGTPLSALPLLTPAEEIQLTLEWNATDAVYPAAASLRELFEEQVRRAPERTALVSGGAELTYGELDRRAGNLALHLRRLGVGPESLVGLCLGRSLELIVGLLGIVKAGGAYVPLDTSYPPERLAFLLADTGLRVLVGRQDALAALPPHTAEVVLLAGDGGLPPESPRESPPEIPATGGGDSLAYVMYTSGSTGRPKGVAVTHRGVIRLVCETTYAELGGSQVFLQIAPVAFDASTCEIWGALLNGGRLVLPPEGPPVLAEIGDEIDRHGVTLLWLTTGLFHLMVEHELERLRPLGQLLAGGDVLSPRLVERVLVELPHTRMICCYGPTENTTITSYSWLHRPDEIGPSVSLGRPIANTQVYVLDSRWLPVPIGIPGELCTGGDGLARGYLHRPELTAETFIPDPLGAGKGAGGRLYRTGDLARYLPDGRLEFLGRIDNQVKLRGFRIEPGEIEAYLREHPAVRDCAVVLRENPPGNRFLTAYVVAAPDPTGPGGTAEGESAARTALQTYLAGRLPGYMVPAAFVFLAAFPLTPNGKLDRRRLPAPNLASPDAASVLLAPRTPTERTLARIWTELLGVERVGLKDDFFALGGHSLLATVAVTRLRAELGVELPLRAFFESPQLAELAAQIEALAGVADVAGIEGALPPTLPPIAPVSREQPLPLSFAQERLWFLDRLDRAPIYNETSAFRLRGPLDVPGLRRALSAIVARHEVLRTSFPEIDGRPVQRISAAAEFLLPVVDFSALPHFAGGEGEVRRIEAEEGRLPFDLVHGPLRRGLLARLGERDHVVLVWFHHIVSDGWSTGVFQRDLSALYPAGDTGGLPALPIQYADFAVWQRQWLQGEILERQLGYWRERLAGAPMLELPLDHPRLQEGGARSAMVTFGLDAEVEGRIRTESQRRGASPFMVVLAAFQALLLRYTGEADSLVGSPIANRTYEELEGLIGFFVNLLALRTDLAGDPGFGELVTRVRETALGAYAHQDLPFDKLVAELNSDRDLGGNPLFRIVFQVANLPAVGLELPGLTLEEFPASRFAKVDVNLMLVADRDRFTGILEYDTRVFDPPTLGRFVGHLERLMGSALGDPLRPLSTLPLLSPAEELQLRQEWNATGRPYPRAASLGDLFAEQVRRTPDAMAVTAGESSLSYGELDRRAGRLARHLRRLGVGVEDRVGLCLGRSLELILGMLAIVRAGGAYVPLDPSYPPERLAFLLEDTGLRVILARRSTLAALPPYPAEIVLLEEGDAGSGAGGAEDARDESPFVGAGGASLAYVVYTSGSTGRPKGVAVPHRAVARLVRETDYVAFGPDEVFLQFAPVAFDASTFEIWGALLNGGRVLLAPDAAAALADLGDLIDRHGITTVFLTTALFHLMVDHQLARLSPLRQILTGGELMSPGHVRQALAGLPETRLTIFYGPTENTTFTTCCPLREPAEVGATVPLGRPIANTRTYVLDALGQLAPVGVVGELCAGGEGLARGYLDRPELTAERFVPDPGATGTEAGGRLYRTGDLARYLPDGRLDFLGRIDHQVKLRGFRIEPGEIEARLLEHPAVREVVVVVREQPVGNRFLVAYFVGAPPEEAEAAVDAVDEGALAAHLRAHLPEHMVPAAFVRLKSLPLTANGKVDRPRLPLPDELRPAGAAGLAGDDGRAPESSVAVELPPAPRSAVAELLADLWCDILRIEKVEPADSFFERGGYSLVATRLSLRVREALGIEISLYRLFEDPTFSGMVEEVEQALRQDREEEAPPLVPVDRDGPLPLSFAQQRLWIIDQLEPGSSAYQVPLALRLTGRLDVAALHRGLAEILRRHEALRTRFELRDGNPSQVISPYVPPPLPRIDLTALDAGERGARGAHGAREAELRRLNRAESLRPFDLARGPLFRATLVLLAGSEHALLTTMHHIVSDGWSVGVLLSELVALYGALLGGREDAGGVLPELPVQYADFAVWQRRWLSGRVLEEELAYWREALAGVPVLDLPTDRPRHWVRSGAIGASSFVLPPALTADLVQLGRRQGLTLFMVLLAAFKVLLHRYSGQGDLAVGTPIANRTHRGIEGLVGFFVNTLVLRASFPATASMLQVFKRVRETALGAYSHQDLPFEKLVEELRPERGPHRSPFFQVFFILQNMPLPARRLPGLTLTPLPIPSLAAKFELTLSMEEAEDGSLHGAIEYGSELFDASTVDRLLAHFTNLLAAVSASATAAKRKIAGLPLVGAAERHQLLAEWNDTRRALPRPAVVHELFVEQAASRPDAVALLSARGERISYAELDRRSDRLAGRLRRLGLPLEAPVGVFLERSPEMVLALLAVLKAGGAYVPLDPAYPVERLELMLRDSRAPFVVTQEALAGRLAGPGAMPAMPVLVLVDREGEEPDPSMVPPAVDAANLAYVIYTSGSTGRPKGVAVVHAGIVRLVRSGGFAVLGPDEVVLHVCPVSFDVATFEIWGALLSGATLSVLPSGAPSLDELGETIARDGITTLWLTSGLFALMVNHRLEALRPVRQILAGGDVVPLPQARRVLAELPGCRLIDGYGPTENTTFTACHPIWRGLEGRDTVPIGRPIGNTGVAILDGGGEPVPVGVPGELSTGGLGLARGYLDRPDLTAERFLPDGVSGRPGERLYRTGDRARWLADGTIEFLGRLDHQVKVRGFRVELGEIESALGSHPAVTECVVVTREDRPGDRRLVAYLVPAAGLEPAPGELAGFLRQTLPEYMIPAVFVTLPAIPLSPNSKPDRAALPPPPDAMAGPRVSYVPPRTRLEERIAAVWREVLGVPRVGIHDNFFGLGGHSLLILQAVARLREETGRPLSPIEMFEYPTVAALAKRLAPEEEETVPVLAQSRDRGAARRGAVGAAGARRPRPRPVPVGAGGEGDEE